jgi:hypothetical protein
MIPPRCWRDLPQVERDLGITVSVGLSVNKFLAKIASDLDKPRGFAALDQDEAREMLAERPSDSSTASAPHRRKTRTARFPRDQGSAARTRPS